MSRRIKTIAIATFIASSLMMRAAPAVARDYWHWSEQEHRWDHRADLRSDRNDLAEARRQLSYDRNHHARRRTIAQDEARIRDLERDIREDRRAVR
jgi:hypothetical protein